MLLSVILCLDKNLFLSTKKFSASGIRVPTIWYPVLGLQKTRFTSVTLLGVQAHSRSDTKRQLLFNACSENIMHLFLKQLFLAVSQRLVPPSDKYFVKRQVAMKYTRYCFKTRAVKYLLFGFCASSPRRLRPGAALWLDSDGSGALTNARSTFIRDTFYGKKFCIRSWRSHEKTTFPRIWSITDQKMIENQFLLK